MKVAIVDIKPNTPKYDACLTEAIEEIEEDDINVSFITSDTYVSKYKCCVVRLCRLFKGAVVKTNKIRKGINWLFNYIQILFYARKNKYDIMHFEWLVFLQQSSVELFFIRLLSKHSKIILTVHNIYPHNIDVDHNSKGALSYRDRFKKLDAFVSHYVVHTQTSATELSKEFNIPVEKISVCIHGLFLPDIKTKIEYQESTHKHLFKIAMFGVQSPYKGTDLLIDAISELPLETKEKISVTIAGMSSEYRETSWLSKASSLGVKWIDKLLDEAELHQLLQGADLIVFPYRVISQSGALLLALSYSKPLIVSDLPSFKETLSKCPDSVFFKSGDSRELSQKIGSFVNGLIDITPILKGIEDIQKDLSWDVAAKQTIETYKKVCSNKSIV